MTQICGIPIKFYAELGAALSIGEFDMNIPKIDPLFERLRGLLRSQVALHWMSPFRQPTYQVIPFFLRRSFSTRRRRGFLRTLLCCLFHLDSQAERTHIRPYFFDIRQTLRLLAALSHLLPAERGFLILRPYRVLLFMVYDDFINRGIFSIGILKAHSYLLEIYVEIYVGSKSDSAPETAGAIQRAVDWTARSVRIGCTNLEADTGAWSDRY